MARDNTQAYKATVTFTWTSEVFEGDPDDVFLLAEAEKKYLEAVCESAIIALNPVDAEFEIVSVEPELGEK